MATIQDDSWEILDAATGFLGATYGTAMRVRMVAVRLRPGELLVISPGAHTSEARFAALEQWGTPTFLLAPNHFHNLGLRQWHKRYPQATVCAHPAALPRLRKKLPDVPLVDLHALQGVLPPQVRVVHAPHSTQGELALSVDTAGGVAWFITDCILNESHLPGGLLGAVCWILGFRERLMTNPHFRRMYITDKREHAEWLVRWLDAEQPTLFVPSHGDILRGPDVAARLRAITIAG